jgi:autotransporter adhesin
MKKQNGHSNGHVQSKNRSIPSGLQATLAKKIAHRLAQTAARNGDVGAPKAVGNLRASMRAALAGTSAAGDRAPLSARFQNRGVTAEGGEFSTESIGTLGGGFSNGAGISITHSGGATANANANGDISIGGDSSANSGTNGNNNFSVAVGDSAKANASQSVALGNRSNASGGGDIAIGSRAFTSNNDAIAIGTSANATANDALAIGSQVSVAAVNAIALGSNYVTVDSTSTGAFVVAPNKNGGVSKSANAVAILGQVTNAAGGVAIGSGASATNTNTMALGGAASASAINTMAVGANAKALANNSVALGTSSVVSRENAVSVGRASTDTGGQYLRQVINMGAGTETHDAVNVSQLSPVISALGGGAKIDSTTGAVTGPTYTLVHGGTQTTLSGALSALDHAVGQSANTPYLTVNSTGPDAVAAGADGISLGSSASAAGNDSVSVGRSAQALGNNTVVIGYNAKSNTGAITDGTGNIAIGSNAVINNTGIGALAIGYNASIRATGNVSGGIGSIALGYGAAVQANSSTAIGVGAYVGRNGSVAFGANAVVPDAQDSSVDWIVALGVDTLADEPKTVSIGNKSTDLRRRIVNMDAGLSAYEAVNIGQLQPLVTAFGGNAAIDPNTGAVTGPTYTLANGGTQTTLSGALSALDKAISDGTGGGSDKYVAVNPVPGDIGAQASGTEALAVGSAAYALADGSVAIGANSVADAPNTFSIGTPAQQRKIVNVAAGVLSSTSTDAVNGAQLDDTNQRVDVVENVVAGFTDSSGTPLVVTYTNAIKDAIQLGNAGRPVEVMNVAAATQPNDAVNLAQLNATADALRGELGGDLKYVKINSTGADANAVQQDAIAIGSDAIAGIEGSVALGVRARASAAHAVALGSDSMADRLLAVSLGNSAVGLTRQLVNLQAGVQTTDAVNVGQLQPMVTALGGGASIDPVSGAVTGPTYTLANGGAQTSLDGALSALDQAISDSAGSNPYLAINSTGADAAANGTDAIGLGSGASATASNAVALGANAVANLPDTVSVGSPGGERKIVNVAAGEVSPTSFDAVNGAQLDATDQAVTQVQNTLTNSGLIGPDGSSLAVTYSSAAKNIIFVGTTGTPAEIMNVADGIANSDAATVGQVTNAVGALRTELSNNLNYVKVRATGTNALASGTNSVAIGSSASASDTGTVAIGTGARASGLNAVALGANSSASEARTVSVGSPGNERKIVNVADGDFSSGSTDAATCGQIFDVLNAFGASRAGILDVENPIYAIEGVQGNNTASLNGGDPTSSTAVAFGAASSASGTDTVSFGLSAIALSDNAVALGSNSTTGAGLPYAVSVGSDAQTTGMQAIALGAHVQANADNAVAVGNNSTWALGVSSVAIGDNAQDRGAGSVAIGKGVRALNGTANVIVIGTSASVAANVSNAIALGANASVVAGNHGGVALGQGAVANRGNAVSLGATTGSNPVGTRQIVNLSAGTQGTDAVNVTQLQGVTTALGGGAGVGADGSILPPSYTVAGTNYANVGAAISAVASMAGTDPNAVAYDDAAKDTVTLSGASGTLLTNLSAGSVTTTSTDAINGSQLFGTAQSIATGLGGGASVNPNGTVTPPLYVIGTTTANDVGGALGNLQTVINNQLAASGLVDAAGQAIAAVTYDSASQSRVTLGGSSATSPVLVTNVAEGMLSETSTDAVSGSQLFATNLTVTELVDSLTNGGVLGPAGESLAVTYADSTKQDVTLGTAGTPVTMSNVANATLGPSSTEAVNGAQLNTTNLRIDDLEGKLASGGVLDPTTGESRALIYDDDAKDSVTLGGTGAAVSVPLHNVAAGTAMADAVNVSQLQGVAGALGGGAGVGADGSIVPPSYTVDGTTYSDVAAALDAVASMAGTDPNAVAYDDAAKDTVTLDGAQGTLLTNLRDGAIDQDSTDAVNGSQLNATNEAVGVVADELDNLRNSLVGSDGEWLALLYDNDQRNSVTLGTAGTPVTLTNLAAVEPTQTSTAAVNGSQLYETNQAIGVVADALDNLGAEGLFDPVTGALQALVYDDDNKDSVTLGGAGAVAPVPLHNLATGTADTDGVNVAQLTSGLSTLKDELTNGAIDLKYIKVNSAGAQAQANGNNSVSIGSGCTSTGSSAVAIGTGARAVSANSVALGYNSVANETDEVVSVGNIGRERRIINVNNGNVSAGSTDAVNGDQLFAVRKAVDALAAKVSGANGVNDASDPISAVDGRSGNNIASLNGGDPRESTAAALGTFSIASGSNALAVGLHNLAGSDCSVALGYLAQTGADHDYSVAVGADVQTNAPRAVAIGTEARANGDYALAVGSNRTFAIGNSSIAMGDGVKAHGKNSIAIGRSAIVAANTHDALALGAEASVASGAIGSVALGHGAVADRGNAISIGGGTVGSRQIIHVAAGTEDDDAVNVKQLRDVVASLMAEIQTLRSQLGTRQSAQ